VKIIENSISKGFDNKFIHDFRSSGTIRNQNHITNRPHNGAFGIRHI
jgi:hypothetical protein